MARVYRNDGGSFVNANAVLMGAVEGQLGWGDYDNDGDLDVLVQSVEDAGNFSLQNPQLKLYRNDDCDRIYLPNVVRE